VRFDHLPLTPWRWLGLPAWCLYRPLVALRNMLYDYGWLAVLRLPAPVISVGNLAVGGTGKTPLVAWIAAHLATQGHRPVVLMRGYGGDVKGNDEARMLAVPVVCNPDRVAAGHRALANGATCLVLDDGFQHRRLHRHVDIVVIDALRPWAGGAVLPLGLLREGLGSLRRAQVIVVSRCDQVDEQALAAINARLAPLGKPVLHARHAPTSLIPFSAGPTLAPTAFADQPVLLASGIGNPEGFERTAKALGWSVVKHHRFPDHHQYSRADADGLMAEATRLGAHLVMTAKDAVKMQAFPGISGWSLAVELAFSGNDAQRLEQTLTQACPPVSAR